MKKFILIYLAALWAIPVWAPRVWAGEQERPTSGRLVGQTRTAENPNPTPETGSAADNGTEEGVVTGQAGIIFTHADGEDESAKFEEYRDISREVSGEVYLRYEKKDRYFLEFDADHIGADDQYLFFRGGRYGQFNIDLSYDKIPHRFALDARTLYSGTGSGNQTLDDALQADLQGRLNLIDRANQLNNFFSGAFSKDVEFQRKKAKGKLDLLAFDPFSARIEIQHEKKDGTRPLAGAFGLSNDAGMVEILEPIDYDTTTIKLIGEYAQRPLVLNASYYYSMFRNNLDTLTWDNPFRLIDSTRIGAGTGPSTGLIDLAPDNDYHNVSLTGSYMDLPFQTRIAATASWGWMIQNDDLIPFTTNTAIVPGAFENAPFDAFDAANLPANDADAKVFTSLYNVSLTSRPLDFMRVKGKFRYFGYDNDTDETIFPGYVITDERWIDKPIVNLPISYRRTTAGTDLGFNLIPRTWLNLGYTFDGIHRNNREVSRQDDHKFIGSVDTTPFPWLDLRASYEKTFRNINNYDVQAPLEAFVADDPPRREQLEALRKYTETDRDRDRIQLLATVYPFESLAVSGSFTYGEDDFDNSDFGLLNDKHHIFSIDADYAVSDSVNFYAFYNYEKYKNRQKASGFYQAGGIVTDWSAKNEDVVNTVGGGVKLALIPGRLDFDLSYSFSDVDGNIAFAIPADEALDPGEEPADFNSVDDTKLHILETKLNCRVWESFYVTFGYLYEKFDSDDFNTEGFAFVPTTANGVYNGALLMGTLPEDYSVNLFYAKLSYRF